MECEQAILSCLHDYNNLVNQRCLQLTTCIEKGNRQHDLKSLVASVERDILLKWCSFLQQAQLNDDKNLSSLPEELEQAISKYSMIIYVIIVHI